MRHLILVVDDERNLRTVLSKHLERDGHEVITAASGNQARRLVEEREDDEIACVFSDLRMPDGDGVELFQWMRSNRPDLPLVFLTAHGTVDLAMDVMRQGAFDFLTKPFDAEEVRRVARRAVAVGAANFAHRGTADPDSPLEALIGETAAMEEVKRLIRKIAPSPSTVLVRGESGTGKELVAEALHALSDRSDGPLIKVNCSAIPETLFESELFGHEKGAFTGATHRRPGRFELADGGTLFLDEIGDLPPAMQVKILRVLQERSFERVGGVDNLTVDVRVVTATNVDLEEAVKEGRFREDLFYRLNVVPIELPPLRERMADLPALVRHITARLATRLKRPVPALDSDVMASLQSHDWPGNIRELENVLERALLLMDGARVTRDDLPAVLSEKNDSVLNSDEVHVELPSGTLGLKDAVKQTTRIVEERMIREALEAEDGNVTRTAKRLGISRKGLQLKMRELGLREEREDED